ncbi:tetratricopeptide repeat domain-containing protein [Lophiotrema nucula]|uniref:Tetratricopeptide repeat domain-containing protein n=1 Tax=Lophiotrema nucula TaxID=690887 RepID=A0A6A5ZBV6_9PLEO|nr:tetratricopeptide repeat domain-containing protein [Lophiotrema nucula]
METTAVPIWSKISSSVSLYLAYTVICSLVLIGWPGFGSVEEWAIRSTSWRSFLRTTGSRVKFMTFDLALTIDDKFSLESVSEEGNTLIEALRDHQAEQQQTCPIAFICHSLGCSILKQALCIANAQNQNFSTVLHSILAIIFLGGPNPTTTTDEDSDRIVALTLSSNSKLSKQCQARVREGMHVIANVSRLFHDVRLNVELLSLYESEKTKVKLGRKDSAKFFGSSKKLMLVDRAYAATGAPKEQQWELAGDHVALCKLQQQDGRPDQRLREWLTFVFSGELLVAAMNRLNSSKIPDSPVPSMTSLSSYDAAKIALSSDGPRFSIPASKSNDASNDPTAGSSTAKGWEVVPIINSFTAPRKLAQLPCFMIDTLVRNKDFFGRESMLAELDDWLLPVSTDKARFSSQPNGQRHVVLCGMGGIGKTSIAMEFAFSRQTHFDAIFWIRADETAKLEQDFAQIASSLGLEDAAERTNPIISRELAMGWLSNPRKVLDEEDDIIGQTEACWLLIFDNADSPENLQDYWPLSQAGSILVTSRDPLSKTSPSIAGKSIDLSPLTDEEGAHLLQRLSHNAKEGEASLEIASKLGGLPLAISQMAAIIRYQYLSLADFIERYDDDASRKHLHAFEHAGSRRKEARGNIASIWAVQQLDEGAMTIIQLAAILDPDCIQERIFEEFAIGVEHIQEYPANWMAYSTARAELIKRSLVRRNESSKELWIHRVLQDSVKAQMSDERLLDIFTLALTLLTKAWGSTALVNRHDWRLSKTREGLFPHAMSLRASYENIYKDTNPKASVPLAELMNEAGWWQHERGSSHESKAFWNLALDICEQNPGKKTGQLLADVHYGLAAAANETNDAHACLHHTKLLLDMRKRTAEETREQDLRLAIAHNEFGIALVMNGQYKEAVEAYETSIEVYKNLRDYWPSMDTNPRTNLGFTLWVTGQLDAAWNCLQDLLHDRERKFGVNDSESYRTGRVVHGMGNVKYDQGEFEIAERFHHRALVHYQRTLGNNHHKTADLCHKMAQHCFRREEFENANRALIGQALKIWRLKETVFAPEIARTTFLEAKVYMQSGDVQRAAGLFKEARDLRNSISGARKKGDASLREADFDDLVTFFSR